MQLRLRGKTDRNTAIKSFVIKTILFALIFMFVIFLVDKIEMPAPNKFIKQEISNDKLITVK